MGKEVWPIVWATCGCPKDWQMPVYVRWGSCGVCGEVPVLKESIPQDQWPSIPV